MSGPVEYRDGPNMHIEADLPTFNTVEPKAVEWLWPGRIALGKLTLMVGDPGLGKSLIGLALLTHVSRGAPWPVDHSPCQLGRAVLISAEDDVNDTIRPRLDAASADVSRIAFVDEIDDIDVGISAPKAVNSFSDRDPGKDATRPRTKPRTALSAFFFIIPALEPKAAPIEAVN